jgi:hypothetical protein
MSRSDEDRARESREALDRVARDSQTLGSSLMGQSARRFGDHISARDAVGAGEGGETDPIELWGRRIGRTLSVFAFIGLSLWLAVQLGFIEWP